MNACFKAFAAREVSEDANEFTQVDWIHPQWVNDNELNDFMYGIYEGAAYEAWENHISYDWITVVAYDMSWNAFVACDYERMHPGGEDRHYGDDIADELRHL